MNIGIIGVGGVGGYFGGKICRSVSAQGSNVFFVARGEHLAAIRRNGLHVATAAEGEWICHPTLATNRLDDLPMLDLVLLCVKSYDLRPVVLGLRHKVAESTFILPLLNGIDIHERIRGDLDLGRILPATVYVSARVEDPGRVRQMGAPGRIVYGGDPRSPGAVPAPVRDLLATSGIESEWFQDVYPEIWAKYVFIAAFALVTAAFDKTLGQVMESNVLGEYVLSIMREIVDISRKMGINLPETVVETSFQKARNFPHETKTSFQRDVESAAKPDERDIFGGTILRLGDRYGLDTPVTRELCRMIERRKPWPEGV